MTAVKDNLLDYFVKAVATHEGFFVTEAEAKVRKMIWPTPAQKNNNPINLEAWGSHPIKLGYVQFPTIALGWKAAKRQCERNIFERKLSFFKFFAGERDKNQDVILGGYAGFRPRNKGNDPEAYATFVLQYLHEHWSLFPPVYVGESVATIETVISSLVAA